MLDINSLNNKQKEAVTYTNGPLLIIAGAGSGKTRVLTQKIAYLIEEKSFSPSSILAITFTNKAANEMKERVKSLTLQSNSVWIGTFHSICIRLLREKENANKLNYSKNFSICDETDKQQLIKMICSTNKYNIEISTIKSMISKWKNECKLPNQVIEEFKFEKENSLNIQVAKIYYEYQRNLIESNTMDFDDIIMNTLFLLEYFPEIKEYYKKKFKYLLVDEYQDTNKLQYLLIHYLLNYEENICVVGDDNQAIYGWRGADIKNILNFEKDFNNANKIILDQNYRSTNNILKLANSVITKNPITYKKNLWSTKGDGSMPIYFKVDNEINQANLIANKIKENIEKYNYVFSDFAILYRTNSASANIEKILVKKEIPYYIVGNVKFYEREEIKDLLSYLSLITNQNNIIAFRRIINTPKRNIGEITLNNFFNYHEQFKDKNLFKTILYILNNKILTKKTESSFKEFIQFYINFFENTDENDKNYASKFIDYILEKTNYISYIENKYSSDTQKIYDKIDNIKELIIQIKDFEKNFYEKYKDSNLIDYSSTLIYEFMELVNLSTNFDNEKGNKVALMSVHNSKGLEFKNVFIVNFATNQFPSYFAMEEIKKGKTKILEEERRLLYVAITRAMENLYIIYPKQIHLPTHNENTAPSLFYKDMNKKYFKIIDNSDSFITKKEKIQYKSYDDFDDKNSIFNFNNSFFDKFDNSKYSKKVKKSEENINTDLKINDIVKHKFFGIGKIKNIKNQDIYIEFKEKGIKIFDLPSVKLTKIK